MIWRNPKTPEEYKKQARAVFRAACGEPLWKFLEEKENETNRSPDYKADPRRA